MCIDIYMIYIYIFIYPASSYQLSWNCLVDGIQELLGSRGRRAVHPLEGGQPVECHLLHRSKLVSDDSSTPVFASSSMPSLVSSSRMYFWPTRM